MDGLFTTLANLVFSAKGQGYAHRLQEIQEKNMLPSALPADTVYYSRRPCFLICENFHRGGSLQALVHSRA
jgi:hypothetical protein